MSDKYLAHGTTGNGTKIYCSVHDLTSFINAEENSLIIAIVEEGDEEGGYMSLIKCNITWTHIERI